MVAEKHTNLPKRVVDNVKVSKDRERKRGKEDFLKYATRPLFYEEKKLEKARGEGGVVDTVYDERTRIGKREKIEKTVRSMRPPIMKEKNYEAPKFSIH